MLQFVAVAAHPPESTYHKIGVPLTGRGVIQIWCLLNVCSEDAPSQVNKKRKLGTKKKERVKANESIKLPRPRGRPRKKPINENVEKIDSDSQYVQSLAIEYLEDISGLYSVQRASADTNEQVVSEYSRTKLDDSVNANALLMASQVNKEKETVKANESTRSQRPRGRPRKKPVEKIDSESQYVQPLAIDYPEDSSILHSIESASANTNEHDDSVNEDALLMAFQVNKEKETLKSNNSTKPQRLRRRPLKKPVNVPVEKIDSESQYVQPLAIEYPEDSSRLHSVETDSANTNEQVVSGDSRAKLVDSVNADALLLASRVNKKPKLGITKKEAVKTNESTKLQRPRGRTRKKSTNEPVEKIDSDIHYVEALAIEQPEDSSRLHFVEMASAISNDVALPRMMLCLAHNGKVAWDVKWRPFSARDSESMHRMGYLAVLLGNGALEVYDLSFNFIPFFGYISLSFKCESLFFMFYFRNNSLLLVSCTFIL